MINGGREITPANRFGNQLISLRQMQQNPGINSMEISITNLSKRYSGNKFGLQDFNLELKNGVMGLIGPNGAGKSTLMRILATISKPTGGKVTLDGTDIVKFPDIVRKQLGYLPQDFGVYPNLTAMEFLGYMAAIKGFAGRGMKERIGALLEELNLTAVRNRPIGTYSGGMRQRIGIAQVLLGDPKFLILDEPTTGLDPEEQFRFRNLVAQLSGERIILLSSHIVSDIETMAGNIAIVFNGRLLQQGPAPEKGTLEDTYLRIMAQAKNGGVHVQ